MGMNQPSPEEIQMLMSQQGQLQDSSAIPSDIPQEMPMGELDGGLPSMGELPMGEEEDMMGMNALADSMMPEEVDVDFDPMMLIEEVITAYAQFALKIASAEDLDRPVQSKIMVEQAQALSTLVPLLKNDSQMELMKAEQELELKREEMNMNMEMKQVEMQMKQQEHEMNLQFKQSDNQLKLQQSQENHQYTLVQKQEQHQSHMEQQKQAAQLKQSSNSGSNQPKK